MYGEQYGCVCVCPTACLYVSMYNVSETLQPLKDRFPCFIHSEVYSAVENPGNSTLPTPSFRPGWMVSCRRTRLQSATSPSPLWEAAKPHVMAACHTFSIVWVDTLWFLALVTDWGSSSPPGELFISQSPIWTIRSLPLFWWMGQKLQKWESSKYNLTWDGARPNSTVEICIEKPVSLCGRASVQENINLDVVWCDVAPIQLLLWLHSFGLTVGKQSSCETWLMLSFPGSVAPHPEGLVLHQSVPSRTDSVLTNFF